jgi:hypothetical protein
MASFKGGGGGSGYTATAAGTSGSQAGMTSTQQAYGTPSGAPGPSTAANGTIMLGLAGTAVLVFLWWTLPR